MFLGTAAGGSKGWVLMTNYLTSTPSSHDTIHSNAKGVVQASNGKYYALEQYGNNTEPRRIQIIKFDDDGTNVSYERGHYKSGASNSTVKHVFAQGMDIDDDDVIWLYGTGYDSTQSSGQKYWGFVEKWNPATDAVAWGTHMDKGTNKPSWNATAHNPKAGLCLFRNQERAAIIAGSISGGTHAGRQCAVNVLDVNTSGVALNGEWSGFGTTYTTGNNRLNVSWGSQAAWGVQSGSSSTKRLFMAGQWTPPNYAFGTTIGVFDDTPTNCYHRSDAYSSSGSGNWNVYAGDIITNAACTTGYVVVRRAISQGGDGHTAYRPEVAKITDASGSYNGSLSFTMYQTESALPWGGPACLDLDSSGNLYCCAHLEQYVTNSNTSQTWQQQFPALIKWNTSGNIEWMYKISRPNNFASGDGSGVGIQGTYPSFEGKVMVNNDGNPVVFGYNSWQNEPGQSHDGVDRADWTTPFYIMIPADGKLESGTYGTGQNQWTVTNLAGSWTAATQTNYWSSNSLPGTSSTSGSESSSTSTNKGNSNQETTSTTILG